MKLFSLVLGTGLRILFVRRLSLMKLGLHAPQGFVSDLVVGAVMSRSTVRKEPAIGGKERRKHARRTGEVIISWNLLHMSLQVLFTSIISKDTVELGNRIWMTLQADSAQRDILRAAIEVAMAGRKPIRDRALWIVKVVDNLSALRNDFTHTPINFLHGKIVPSVIGSHPKRVDRLSAADTGKIQRALSGDLNYLSAFTVSAAMHYLDPQHYSLPKIPRLRTPSVYPEMRAKLRFLPSSKGGGIRRRASG